MKECEVIKPKEGDLTASNTSQIYFEVSSRDKFEALCRIIDLEEDFYGVIFCRTKMKVADLSNHLIERGYDVDALSGDVSQVSRERILKKFKKGSINILVATDVAARGIDVQNLTHVINYSLPHDPQAYVHRIGRTGRAGKQGIAITFITPSEYRKLKSIEQHARTKIVKAQLPTVADVIENKTKRIYDDLAEIADQGVSKECQKVGQELLDKYEPHDIVSVLLQYAFQDELDKESYPVLNSEGGRKKKSEPKAPIDVEGKTRLFVTHGKKNGLTAKKLISAIRGKCGIVAEDIEDIEICNNFSFVTMPFEEAEQLLSFFQSTGKDDRLFITKAKHKRK